MVKVVFSREVREPYTENGKKRLWTSYEDMEFVFPKEYSKMFRPVFSGEYDFDAKEEKGVITVILTPASRKANSTQPLERKELVTT